MRNLVRQNPSRTQAAYEHFLYTLPAQYPSIQHSTLTYIPSGTHFGRAEGFLLFGSQIALCVVEYLTFLPHGEIEHYGYEVSVSNLAFEQLIALSAGKYCTAAYPGKQKLYWYDSFSHPNDPTLAATDPHHKHVHPNIKRNRIPAPELSFARPNLPFLIREVEQLLKSQK
ncbi:MAG: DUF6516 family protein [Anaerolineales bacterium]